MGSVKRDGRPLERCIAEGVQRSRFPDLEDRTIGFVDGLLVDTDYSLADSFSSPIFSRCWYFFSTDSL